MRCICKIKHLLSSNLIGQFSTTMVQSIILWSLLNRGGHIEAIVTGPKVYLHMHDLNQGGPDVPCKYIFYGEKGLVKKVGKTGCIVYKNDCS